MIFWVQVKGLFGEISFLDYWLLFLHVVSNQNFFSSILQLNCVMMVINADRCSWFFGFLVISGTSWMLSSIYWTKRSTIISHIHSKCYTFAKWIRSSLLSLFYCLITRLIGGFDSCYSFVSVIHLLVGVVYCLVSWSVGLPKRAVSISFFLQLIVIFDL